MNRTTIAAELAIDGKKKAARKNVWPRIFWLTITASERPSAICAGTTTAVRNRVLGIALVMKTRSDRTECVVLDADELTCPSDAPVEEADEDRVADGEDLEHQEEHHRDGDEGEADHGLVTALRPETAPEATPARGW